MMCPVNPELTHCRIALASRRETIESASLNNTHPGSPKFAARNLHAEADRFSGSPTRIMVAPLEARIFS